MALDGKGAEPTDNYAHEGLTPPSEIPKKPIEKDSSHSTISKGSSQNGIAPVKGSPLGRYNRIHERRMLCIFACISCSEYGAGIGCCYGLTGGSVV